MQHNKNNGYEYIWILSYFSTKMIRNFIFVHNLFASNTQKCLRIKWTQSVLWQQSDQDNINDDNNLLRIRLTQHLIVFTLKCLHMHSYAFTLFLWAQQMLSLSVIFYIHKTKITSFYCFIHEEKLFFRCKSFTF